MELELTLKQARSLEIELRELKLPPQVTNIRAYDIDLASMDLLSEVQIFNDRLEVLKRLNVIRHHIKGDLNEANMDCGVSCLLNERDELYARRDLLKGLGLSDSAERQLTSIDPTKDVTKLACVYTNEQEELVKEELKNIQLELQNIYSQINDLNNKVTIFLDEDDSRYLIEQGIVRQ